MNGPRFLPFYNHPMIDLLEKTAAVLAFAIRLSIIALRNDITNIGSLNAEEKPALRQL